MLLLSAVFIVKWEVGIGKEGFEGYVLVHISTNRSQLLFCFKQPAISPKPIPNSELAIFCQTDTGVAVCGKAARTGLRE